MALSDEVEVFRDGKRLDTVRLASVHSYMTTPDGQLLVDGLRRINLASCPGAHCKCRNCERMREEAKVAAAKAPLGQRFDRTEKYVAVVFAGHKQIKVLGLFRQVGNALAYVKANYKTEPLGKTKFVTKDGEVLIVQEHVNVMTLEET